MTGGVLRTSTSHDHSPSTAPVDPQPTVDQRNRGGGPGRKVHWTCRGLSASAPRLSASKAFDPAGWGGGRCDGMGDGCDDVEGGCVTGGCCGGGTASTLPQPESMCSLINESGTVRPQMGQRDVAGGSANGGGVGSAALQPESMCSLIRESGTLRLQMGQSVNLEPPAVVPVVAGDARARLLSCASAGLLLAGRERNLSILVRRRAPAFCRSASWRSFHSTTNNTVAGSSGAVVCTPTRSKSTVYVVEL